MTFETDEHGLSARGLLRTKRNIILAVVLFCSGTLVFFGSAIPLVLHINRASRGLVGPGFPVGPTIFMLGGAAIAGILAILALAVTGISIATFMNAMGRESR